MRWTLRQLFDREVLSSGLAYHGDPSWRGRQPAYHWCCVALNRVRQQDSEWILKAVRAWVYGAAQLLPHTQSTESRGVAFLEMVAAVSLQNSCGRSGRQWTTRGVWESVAFVERKKLHACDRWNAAMISPWGCHVHRKIRSGVRLFRLNNEIWSTEDVSNCSGRIKHGFWDHWFKVGGVDRALLRRLGTGPHMRCDQHWEDRCRRWHAKVSWVFLTMTDVPAETARIAQNKKRPGWGLIGNHRRLSLGRRSVHECPWCGGEFDAVYPTKEVFCEKNLERAGRRSTFWSGA